LGSGNDFADGGDGHDFVNGHAGNDELRGAAGNDHLRGGTGDDVLRGNDGNDRLVGNSGNDELYGGPGRDRLNGGRGIDQLFEDDELAPVSSSQQSDSAEVTDDVEPLNLIWRDVNNDGRVSALDALLVINSLARQTGNGEEADDAWFDDLDVNRDDRVSALDALVIINSLALTSDTNAPLSDQLTSTIDEELVRQFDAATGQVIQQVALVNEALRDKEENWRDSVDEVLSQLDQQLI
jgi:Ca2+-binding RTX toxin-like protein